MIPSQPEIDELWDKYNLPQRKRHHSRLIAHVCEYLASRLNTNGESVNIPLLRAGALLHDIDKAIPRRDGEVHPQTGVRVLRGEGMEDIADLIRHHSVHFILDPATAPRTWEEKVLFVADKMVKDDVIGVERRFDLWFAEGLPHDAQAMLRAALPKVKRLAQEVFKSADTSYDDMLSNMERT